MFTNPQLAETRRNREMKGYRPKQAYQFSLNRRKKTKCRIQTSTWTLIETMLRKDWILDQVSDWFRENYNFHISREWIYQTFLWINKPEEISIAIYDARKSVGSPKVATIVSEGTPGPLEEDRAQNIASCDRCRNRAPKNTVCPNPNYNSR